MSSDIAERAVSGGLQRVIMIGTLPPPVHGMANFHKWMSGRLVDAGMQVILLNTAARVLDGGWSGRIGRLPQVCASLSRLWQMRRMLRTCNVYISVSGGWGQVYDLLFLVILRIWGCGRLVIHHHSAAYLNGRKPLTAALIAASGKGALHVVACRVLESNLRKQYGKGLTTLCLSGVVTVGEESWTAHEERDTFRLGFLSNVMKEKGVFEFIETLKELRRRKLKVNGVIAGPFVDQKTKQEVVAATAECPYITLVGPVFGREKIEFLRSIDVLVFPTRYANETEGLVMHEAMACALPIVSTDRACIPCFVGEEGGKVVPQSEDFPTVAADQIQLWIENAALYSEFRSGAQRRYRENRRVSMEALGKLVGFLSGSQQSHS